MVWSTEMSLWQDALKKAPGSIRPYIQLARIYQEMGHNHKALNLYKQTVDKYSERPKEYRTVILSNVGTIYFAEGKHEQAIQIWSDTIERVKDYRGLRSNLVLVFANLKQWDKAHEQLNHLLEKYPDDGQYNFLKGSYLVKTGRLEDGIRHLRKALQSGYKIPKTLANIGVAYYLRQDYRKADYFLKWSSTGREKSSETLLWLLAVNLKRDKHITSRNYARQLLETNSTSGLHTWLKRISDTDHYLFRDRDPILACLQTGASQESIRHNAVIKAMIGYH
jgi:Tfp pilus assembly protein PilF